MAAVTLEMNGNTVKSARVVLGHVAPIPWISRRSRTSARRQTSHARHGDGGSQRGGREGEAAQHNKYKITLAKAAVKRAILKAAEGRTGGAA